jgi:hypothetical protein
MKITIDDWKAMFKGGILELIIGVFLFISCSSTVGEPEKQYEKGTASYARHNEAKMVGTCGLHATVIDEWEYEGHKYLIVGANQMIHSASCPCHNKDK